MSRLVILFICSIYPFVVSAQNPTAVANNQGSSQDTFNVEFIASLLSTSQENLEHLSQQFVQLWNETAMTCQDASKKIFGNMNSDCRKIRAAIRRGDFLAFTSECHTEWSTTLDAVINAPMLATEVEKNKAEFEKLLNVYTDARSNFCLIEQYSQSHPALYSYFEEAKNSSTNGFANFSNVDLTNRIIEGQRIFLDQNIETQNQQLRELQNAR